MSQALPMINVDRSFEETKANNISNKANNAAFPITNTEPIFISNVIQYFDIPLHYIRPTLRHYNVTTLQLFNITLHCRTRYGATLGRQREYKW